jgi:purine-binding chemotaxis protein CheW
MEDLYLVAEIAGSRVAIKSYMVESVVRIGDIVPVPKSSSNVAGLVALRSRVLTLIDCQCSITGKSKVPIMGDLAVISEINGHFYGLLVDSAKDAITIKPDSFVRNIKLSDNWNEVTTHVARVNDELLLIIDPTFWISGSLAQAA